MMVYNSGIDNTFCTPRPRLPGQVAVVQRLNRRGHDEVGDAIAAASTRLSPPVVGEAPAMPPIDDRASLISLAAFAVRHAVKCQTWFWRRGTMARPISPISRGSSRFGRGQHA